MARSDPLGLVIFDCDGVLVDSELLASRMLSRELTRLGFPLSPEDCLARYTGISMASVVAKVEADWGRSLPKDFVERLREQDHAAFRAELRPVSGVQEALRRLKTPTCVASSGSLAKMRLTLGVTGLLPHFEPRLFSAEMVAHGKPAPDLFLYAARRMGVSPERCVVIEDSAAGVAGARAAGMRVFGFAGGGHAGSGYAEMLQDAGADAVFARMNELPALLVS